MRSNRSLLGIAVMAVGALLLVVGVDVAAISRADLRRMVKGLLGAA